MQVQTFLTSADFIHHAVVFVESVYESGGRYAALAGGATPMPLYAALAESSVIDMSQMHLYTIDERYVPRTHRDSNFTNIQNAFAKSSVPIDLHGFDTNLEIGAALSRFEEELHTVPSQSFDIAIVGIGTDGHVASLFPESDGLYESNRLVAHTTTETLAVRDRLTVTLPVIMKSKHVLVLLQGAQKKMMLEDVLQSEKTIAQLPAKALLNHPNISVYLFDN